MIANQRQIDLRGIEVEVEGDIDNDFLLGKTTEGRARLKIKNAALF